MGTYTYDTLAIITIVLIMYVDGKHPRYLTSHRAISSRVSDIVSLKDRGKFQGILEAVIALSNGFGPVIGGLFAEYTTW